MGLLEKSKAVYEARQAEMTEKAVAERKEFVRRSLKYASGRLPDVELDETTTEYEIKEVNLPRSGHHIHPIYKGVYFTHDGIDFRVYNTPNGYAGYNESPTLEVKAYNGTWKTVYRLDSIYAAVAKPKRKGLFSR